MGDTVSIPDQSVTVGSTATFDCIYNYTDTLAHIAAFTWMKDGVPFVSDTRVAIAGDQAFTAIDGITGTTATSTLTIADVMAGDAGGYSCQATIVTTSNTAILTILFAISLELPSYTVREDLTTEMNLALQVCFNAEDELVTQNATTLMLQLSTVNDTNDTATEGEDYEGTTMNLLFGPNSDTHYCTCILFIDDDIVEPNEVFSINLSVSDPSLEIEGTSSANITILDNDNGLSCVPVLKLEGSEILPQDILLKTDEC